ncbi:two-component regulator propeller domain-containing protein [Marivirga lumbricoides]|uniref:two-component regulator propeller domain-containing protein n=1 Tax=Marivirga lumbricoides TaxID=1046115 RepID=UPI001666CB88
MILTCFTGQLSGQVNDLPKYRFEIVENIPTQRAVATISQDDQGFIWMGTNGLGLFKYNGKDYQSYQFTESDSMSLSNSLIHVTYVDSKNRLWVGTEKGIDLYNREQDNFLHLNLSRNPKSSGISVQAIIENKQGDILVGTHEHGLFKIDNSLLKVSQIKVNDVPEIRNFLINSIVVFDSRVLIGTIDGLYEWKDELSVITPLEFITTNGKERINAPIKTMKVDSKGTIWIGSTRDGLYKVDGNENGRYEIEHFPLTSKRILSLLETPRKTILCGTENDGLFEIDREGKIIHHYLNSKFEINGVKSNSIWSLFLDNKDRIWIGYYNNGVGIYDKLYDRFGDIESKVNDPNSLQASSVTGILEDENGRLWIGMDGGGIDVVDFDKKDFIHLLNTNNTVAKGLASPDVQTLFKDSKGNIWVGTWDDGIYFLKRGSKSFINYSIETTKGEMMSNRILSFSEDSNGIIWMGTFSRGIHSFNPDTRKFAVYDQGSFLNERISYSDVRRVYVDSEDNVWIGSNEGLFKLRINSGSYTLTSLSSRFYSNQDNPYPSLILDIYEDSFKNIWIGTDGAGLCKYDMKTDSFQWVGSETGFNKVTVSTIIEDDQKSIWVGGNNGLSRIDREDSVIKNFTVNDGLLSNDFNNNAAYKSKRGLLFFGTYGGINYFNPRTLPVNLSTPKVYLTDLRIFNKPVKPGDPGSPLNKVISHTDQITLNHNQSVFTLDYASIDFTRPENIHFAYYLEGFETQWNYVKSARNATYTNLPAGTYTFKVKAANSDGVWNDQPTELIIKILPPWWLTHTAIALYFLSLLIIFYFVTQFINARLRAKRAIEQERMRHLQEEALNNKKIQFFTNISHEFRTPLTLILSPLNDILRETSAVPEFFKGKIKTIHRNTMRLNRLIDELMDFRKLQFNTIPLNIESFNLKDLLSEIVDHFKEEAYHRNIELNFIISDQIKTIWADKGKLEKIVFNLLSNAFKSTANSGKISLHASIRPNHIFKLIEEGATLSALEISIEDTGKGIAQEEIGKIFDRFYQIKDRNEQYYSGTGIGLEVVRSFVELHKGDIEVESRVGVGSKFRILIPYEKEQYDLAGVVSTIEPHTILFNEKVPEVSGKGEVKEHKRTLLIIEDNLELRNYLIEELRSDYKVLNAEEGQEGLKKAKKYMPDVIITDVIMPNMNGYEFCNQLKGDLNTSHIPVLMLTAKAMPEDWVEGLEAGADVYLNKPFDMNIMKSHLKQLIINREKLFTKFMAGVSKPENDHATSSLDQQFILNIIKYIKENIRETNLNVEKLADDFSLSRSQLYRKIKVLTGLSANELIRKIRLERAKELLQENANISISEISYLVGFSSPSYFSKSFKDYFGILPNEVKTK